MDNCQQKSNVKRQRADNQSPQHEVRRQRPASPPSLDPSIPSSTKIIDLNDDCLIKIFGYLDLQNLFNVAVANEWLRSAAAVVYERKFGTKTVEIYQIHGTRPKTRSSAVRNYFADLSATPKEWKYSIDIRSSRLCFQYIRCFGPSISKITIDYNESMSKLYEHLHHYVNQYCTESLIEIGFWSKPGRPIEQFVKPFGNVEKVSVMNGSIGDQLPQFVEWFPHLRHLELQNVRLNHRFIAVHFQQLEHLCIDDISNYGLASADAANLLHSNRQLKSLEIKAVPHNMPIETLLDIIQDGNRLISKLHLTYQCEAIPVDSMVVQRFVNEHSALAKLHLPRHQFTPDDIITLTRQLKSLQMFGCHMENLSDFDLLVTQLDEQWHSKFDFNFVTLNRN